MLASIRTLLLLLVLSLTLGASAPVLEPVQLRWQYRLGDVLRYRTSQTLETEMSMMPGQKSRIEQALVFRESVEGVDPEGAASIIFQYEAFRIHAEVAGMTVDYDSTRKGPDAKKNDKKVGALFDLVRAAELRVKVEANGHVADVQGMKAMLEKLAPALKKLDNVGLGPVIKPIFSEEALRKTVEVSVFPDRALEVGETWQRTVHQDKPQLGTLASAIESKLEGSEAHLGGPCAKIGVTVRTSVEKPSSAQSDLDMVAELAGSEGRGTLWFDTGAGRVVELTMSTNMKMRMRPKSSRASTKQSDEIEVDTSVSSKLVLLYKEEPAFP